LSVIIASFPISAGQSAISFLPLLLNRISTPLPPFQPYSISCSLFPTDMYFIHNNILDSFSASVCYYQSQCFPNWCWRLVLQILVFFSTTQIHFWNPPLQKQNYYDTNVDENQNIDFLIVCVSHASGTNWKWSISVLSSAECLCRMFTHSLNLGCTELQPSEG
jgi:hypothetical protein